MSEAILECKNLTKSYSGFPALKDISLTIRPGCIVGLLGPNGSGKTTLIKLANGLLTPEKGSIIIDGKPTGPQTKAIVSYLPDGNFLTPWMSIGQMMDYYADFFRDFDRSRAQAMFSSLHLNMKSKIKTLSKGNKEKVALILTMSRRAKLYLLDEPIAGVDPATRDYILRTIISNYEEDATVVISTHLIADVEQVLSDVIFINQGQIMLNDSVDNVRGQQGKSVDAFFREVFKC